jgi:hypothetical protein
MPSATKARAETVDLRLIESRPAAPADVNPGMGSRAGLPVHFANRAASQGVLSTLRTA